MEIKDQIKKDAENEQKKITSFSVKDLLDMKFPTLVSIENDMIIFHELKGYEVEISRIKTRADLIEWIHHMTGKGKITTEAIAQLIEVVCKYRGWEIYTE